MEARKPTRREQQLMTGMAIDSLEELEKFLNQPSRSTAIGYGTTPLREL